jgi:hypothetical protein
MIRIVLCSLTNSRETEDFLFALMTNILINELICVNI